MKICIYIYVQADRLLLFISFLFFSFFEYLLANGALMIEETAENTTQSRNIIVGKGENHRNAVSSSSPSP
jgi:hypothetical protein